MAEVYEIWLPEKIASNLKILAEVTRDRQMITAPFVTESSFKEGTIYTLDIEGNVPKLEPVAEDWLLALELLGLIKFERGEFNGVIFLTALGQEWVTYQRKGSVGRWWHRGTRAGRSAVLWIFGSIAVILTVVNLVLAIVQILQALGAKTVIWP